MKYCEKELKRVKSEIYSLRKNLAIAKFAKAVMENEDAVFMCIDGKRFIDVSSDALMNETDLITEIKNSEKYFTVNYPLQEAISFISENGAKMEIKTEMEIDSELEKLRDAMKNTLAKREKINEMIKTTTKELFRYARENEESKPDWLTMSELLDVAVDEKCTVEEAENELADIERRFKSVGGKYA